MLSVHMLRMLISINLLVVSIWQLLAAVYNWESFFKLRGARNIANLFGGHRVYPRIFYVFLSIIMLSIALINLYHDLFTIHNGFLRCFLFYTNRIKPIQSKKLPKPFIMATNLFFLGLVAFLIIRSVSNQKLSGCTKLESYTLNLMLLTTTSTMLIMLNSL